MGSWKKLLAAMRSDTNPNGYTYDDAARVLANLGLQLAPSSGGSHRRWRGTGPSGHVCIVGLVDRGHGPLKAVYIKEMLSALECAGILPEEPDVEQ